LIFYFGPKIIYKNGIFYRFHDFWVFETTLLLLFRIESVQSCARRVKEN